MQHKRCSDVSIRRREYPHQGQTFYRVILTEMRRFVVVMRMCGSFIVLFCLKETDRMEMGEWNWGFE